MTHSTDPIIVAADGGGTGSRACAGTLSRGILAEASGGPGNVHSDFDGALTNLTGAITEALSRAGLQPTQDQITAHLGVAGAHTEVEMERVRAALPYGRAHVTGDRATSVRGVLGEADGYVVALGTGTIIARQHALEMRTIGGWGFDLSDQASGAWLGKRLMEEIVLREDRLSVHTDLSLKVLDEQGGLLGLINFSADARPGDYAPFARQVVEAAVNGDPLGQKLIQEGTEYIMRGLVALGFKPGDVLSLAGGLGPHYAFCFPNDFKKSLRPPLGSALEGAFAMAVQAAKAAR